MIRSLLLALALVSSTRVAAAQDGSLIGSTYAVDPQFVPSAESVTLELRAGSYQPNVGNAAATALFNNDLGPYIGAEVDVHVFRIPYVGPFALGVGVGWAEWTGKVRSANGSALQGAGDTGLSMLNANALAVLRADALSRYLDIPLVLSGKIGFDFGYWETGSEGAKDATGVSLGLRWGAQLGFELDVLDRRAARRMDEAWGINHSLLFFEVFGSTMGQWFDSQLPLGTDFAWVAGLQFTF
jgi:hypothetical protein